MKSTRTHIMEFIEKQKTAFIASVDQDGFPNMKAMLAPRKIDGNCFYFSTNTSAMRTSSIETIQRQVSTFIKEGASGTKASC